MADQDTKFSFHDLAVGARFFFSLPRFLRARLTPERATAIFERRLQNREENFLRLAARGIFSRPGSPYHVLLRNTGCRYGDLADLVRKDGLETALSVLFRAGVFLTSEEYKGRREVRRGTLRLAVSSEELHNPLSRYHIPVRSSGSRGAGTPIMIGLDFIAECAVSSYLAFLARDGGNWVKADWEIPGGGALFRLLKYSRFSRPPERWFSHINPSSPGLHPRYAWSVRWLRWAGFLAGVALPNIQYVSVENPLPVVRWMAEVLARGQTPFLLTFASSAVRAAGAACEFGIDLRGAKFMLGGEAVTRAKLQAVARSGAEGIPRYGAIETGPVGYGCLNPDFPDDVHLNSDLHALIQPGPEGERLGIPPEALFLTSLSPHAPFLFLNVCLGDQGVRETRECGCPIETMGLKTHLHTIRSYEKLTGAGMNYLDVDIIRILEEDLPRRFGGGPTDYQLVEEEGERGEPIIRLLVHPRLGALDEAAVKRTFLETAGRGSSLKIMMGQIWKETDILRIERRPPLAARSGKILHLVAKPPNVS